MIKKIRQIMADHKAMSIIRKMNCDVRLVSYAAPSGPGFDCYVCQKNETEASDPDPAMAIVMAFDKEMTP